MMLRTRTRTAPSVDFQTSCRLALGPWPAPITPPDVYPPRRNSDPLWETTWCFRRPHQPASPLREMTDHRSIGMAVSPSLSVAVAQNKPHSKLWPPDMLGAGARNLTITSPPNLNIAHAEHTLHNSAHATPAISLSFLLVNSCKGFRCNAKGDDKKEPAPEEVVETAHRIPTATAVPASLLHRGRARAGTSCSLQRRGVHARSPPPRCRAGTRKTQQAQGQ